MTTPGPPGSPVVAVLVGTDPHPFDRLLGWVSELSATLPVRWVVQHGTAALPPGLQGQPMLDPVELRDLLVRADAVVCHGGPGLIMDARSLGHRPVVVARDPARDEHVDDHQQRFLAFVGARGLVSPAGTLAELRAAVQAAVTADGRHVVATSTEAAASARFGNLVDHRLQRP